MLISVIIPIKNEVKFIRNTLLSILNQKFDGALEIIISDGLSNDGTLDVVEQFQENYKNSSTYINQQALNNVRKREREQLTYTCE